MAVVLEEGDNQTVAPARDMRHLQVENIRYPRPVSTNARNDSLTMGTYVYVGCILDQEIEEFCFCLGEIKQCLYAIPDVDFLEFWRMTAGCTPKRVVVRDGRGCCGR